MYHDHIIFILRYYANTGIPIMLFKMVNDIFTIAFSSRLYYYFVTLSSLYLYSWEHKSAEFILTMPIPIVACHIIIILLRIIKYYTHIIITPTWKYILSFEHGSQIKVSTANQKYIPLLCNNNIFLPIFPLISKTIANITKYIINYSVILATAAQRQLKVTNKNISSIVIQT